MSNPNVDRFFRAREVSIVIFGLGIAATGTFGLIESYDRFTEVERLRDQRAAIHYSEPDEGPRRAVIAEQIEAIENRPFADGAASLGFIGFGGLIIYASLERQGIIGTLASAQPSGE